MKKGRQYQYQGFLLQCPYQEIELEKYSAQMPKDTQSFVYKRNLFDVLNFERQIPLSFLDYHVDTKQDLTRIMSSLKGVQSLYIVDDRIESESDFVRKHSMATKQAFIWHFKNKGFACYLVKPSL